MMKDKEAPAPLARGRCCYPYAIRSRLPGRRVYRREIFRVARPATEKATTPATRMRAKLDPALWSARPASPVFGGAMVPVPVRGAVTVGAGAEGAAATAGCVQVTVTCVTCGGVEKTPPRPVLTEPEP